MRATIKVDSSGFKVGAAGTLSHVVRSTPISVMRAVSQYKRDCLDIPPRCPFRTGRLVAVHEILPIKITFTGAVGTLLIHGPYAASLHEGISRWKTPYTFKTPGTGSHWASSKLLTFGEKYQKIMATNILGRGGY